MSRVGWYRLPNGGGYFHGPVPPGAVEVADPRVEGTVTLLVAPARSASRPVWDTFARSLGVDTTGSKAALIERVEQHVDAVNRGREVEASTLVDQETPDSAEFVDGEPTVDTVDEDSDAVCHED